MIIQMEKLSVYGLISDKDKLIKQLMRKKCVQIIAPDAFNEYESLKEFAYSGSANTGEREQQVNRMSNALVSLAPHAGKKSLFARKPVFALDQLLDDEKMAVCETMCAEIEGISGEIPVLHEKKSKDAFLATSLAPWSSCDLPLDAGPTQTMDVGFYVFKSKLDKQKLHEELSAKTGECKIDFINEDKDQIYAVILTDKGSRSALNMLLKGFGAKAASFDGLTGTVRENLAAIEKRTEEYSSKIKSLTERLVELAADRESLQWAVDSLSVAIQQEKTGDDMMFTKTAFCFSAWVPVPAKGDVERILDKYDCYFEFEKVEQGGELDPPVLLKNNKIVTPYEAITDMYSPPSPWGFDPNPIMSVFYFILFGMMFSDAAYGLILFFGCLFMLKKVDLGPGAQKLIKALCMGGVSTVIWGIIFGSWFGDVIPTVGGVFFNKTIVVPMLLDPLNDPITVLIVSFAIGIIHLFFGMGIKFYMLCKRGHPWEAIFDVGFWYMALIGVFMLLLGGMGAQIGAIIAIAGAVGLILTQGRDKKNPIMKLLSGVMSLYDITGYLSDILSYSRILALGLATGVIASVFNTIGTLGGASFGGVIVFILVFAIGHSLNFAINALGSYVHTARLQYVEFFGKFYESGGVPFRPLAAQTKYVHVYDKEEI